MQAEGYKRCADCSQSKRLEDFYRYAKGTLYNRCKPCHYAYTQAWRATNRARIRELDRKRYPQDAARKKAQKRLRKYGLTQEGFDELWEQQKGVCPICLEPLPNDSLGKDSGDWDLLSVDHCHETGRVRGLLHRRCNLAIEFLLTDDQIARAREYLERNGDADRVADPQQPP